MPEIIHELARWIGYGVLLLFTLFVLNAIWKIGKGLIAAASLFRWMYLLKSFKKKPAYTYAWGFIKEWYEISFLKNPTYTVRIDEAIYEWRRWNDYDIPA